MKKVLLLTTTVLLFAVNANAACNPNLPACQCSYPEMKNGIIGCSESYCETGTKCMPDGSCCQNDNYCESSEKEKQCCSAEQTCDTTKGCIDTGCSGVASCSAQENGTECCTSDGVTGLCLNNSCKTQTCDEGERLYVYYPNYMSIVPNSKDSSELGSAALGCCANNPLENFRLNESGPYYNQVCCSAETPVFDLDRTDGQSLYFACFKGKTQPIYCAQLNTYPPHDNQEKCLSFQGDNDTPVMIDYSYCEYGAEENWVFKETNMEYQWVGGCKSK